MKGAVRYARLFLTLCCLLLLVLSLINLLCLILGEGVFFKTELLLLVITLVISLGVFLNQFKDR